MVYIDDFIGLYLFDVVLEELVRIENRYRQCPVVEKACLLLTRDLLTQKEVNRQIGEWQLQKQNENRSLFKLDIQRLTSDEKTELMALLGPAETCLLLFAMDSSDEEDLLMLTVEAEMGTSDLGYLFVAVQKSEKEEWLVGLNDYSVANPRVFENPKILAFFEFVSVVTQFNQAPNQLELSRMVAVFRLPELYDKLLIDLFWQQKTNIDPAKLIDVIDQLGFLYRKCYVEFKLLYGNLLYLNNEFEKALDVIIQIDQRNLICTQEICLLNLRGKLFAVLGQNGKAMLDWKEVVYDDDFHSFALDDYYEAVLQLTLLLVKSGNLHEAKKVFGKLTRFDIGYVRDCWGADYYRLRGDWYLQRQMRVKAIRMYKMSLSKHHDPKLQEKNKLLELDLWD